MPYAMLTQGSTDLTTTCNGYFYAGRVYGAVYNDLVDMITIPSEDKVEFGYCYAMDEEGHYHKTREYMEKSFIGLHSDTYGFSMGHNPEENKLYASVCGFVLAYLDKEYPCGTPLTCTEGGLLTEMKEEDLIKNPHLLVATYWKSEPQEEWGQEESKIKVNGRKWIKIK